MKPQEVSNSNNAWYNKVLASEALTFLPYNYLD